MSVVFENIDHIAPSEIPMKQICEMPDGIYRNEHGYVAIKGAPGDFAGLNKDELYIGIGPVGAGPIDGKYPGRWVQFNSGESIAVRWIQS